MTCHELAERIHNLRPELSPCEVARLSLLILTQTDEIDLLVDDDAFMRVWKNAAFRLDAAADQHAAVADELEQMCHNGPVQFTPDQLWTLLRAVKVQSQLLSLYTDQPALA
ncbi:hypothetical protein [Novipirellula caenicola]|uniref:Uncharacterized protein n=1 Tax=Novipirellula caenicola TaxID=1536901 RepID=A0ABP9VQV3_9BACT